jgi:hypothetical protein
MEKSGVSNFVKETFVRDSWLCAVEFIETVYATAGNGSGSGSVIGGSGASGNGSGNTSSSSNNNNNAEEVAPNTRNLSSEEQQKSLYAASTLPMHAALLAAARAKFAQHLENSQGEV